jgi:glucose-1-phosphate thymidylyltransferase
MKAIIPLAGRGTRLRPHTYLTPKPLLKVAGKPVMSYILDDLIELGVHEMVFVVGYLGDVIRKFIGERYPSLEAHFVEQRVQDGTAGALKLTEPYANEELLIVFVDTLFDADLSLAKRLGGEWAGVIWAKEVEDYQRFGVVVTDHQGAMTRIVEKPKEPISRLANIGLYYIRDYDLLLEGIHHTLDSDPGPGGEYYLTDAFQYMVDQGARILTAPVGGWYDCGKRDALLVTNHHLLETTRGGVSDAASVESTDLQGAVRIEAGAVVRGSALGPNVTVEEHALVLNSRVRDTIVGAGARIEDCEIHDSLIGGSAVVEGFQGQLSVADHSEVER